MTGPAGRTLLVRSVPGRHPRTFDRLLLLRGSRYAPDEAILQVVSAEHGGPTELGQIVLTREFAADVRDALSLWLTERDARSEATSG